MLMKFFITVTLLFPSFILANSGWLDQLETKKVVFDFYGSAYNGNTIVVYGSSEDILVSTDKGKQWEQIKINDSLIVVDITSIGKNFYGITNQKYGLISSDNGKSWELIDIGEVMNFYKLKGYQNRLYCMAENKIIVFDNNFSKIKVYNFSTDTSYYDFAIANDAIIYSAGKGKIGYINPTTNEQVVYNLDSLSICTKCPTPISFFADDYNVYFLLGKSLYQFFVPSKKIEYFVKPLKPSVLAYATFQNQVYQIYSVTFNANYLDSVYFVKYYKLNDKPEYIKKSGNDRRIYNLTFNHLNFLSKDTIIAVGNRKLIYISYNGGITWKIVSGVNPYHQRAIFLFDSLNARTLNQGVVASYTSNGGTTWLPSRNFFPKFASFSDPSSKKTGKGFLDENKGFMVFSKFVDYDTNYAYTFDGGETFNLLYGDILRSGDSYVAVNKYKKVILFANNYTKGYGRYFITYHFNDTLYPKQVSYLKDVQLSAAFFAEDKIVAIASIGKDSVEQYAIFTSIDEGLTWSKDYTLELPNGVFGLDLFFAEAIDNNLYFQFIYSTGPYYDTSRKVVFHTFYYNVPKKSLTLLWADTLNSNVFNNAFTIINIGELLGKYYMNYTYPWLFDPVIDPVIGPPIFTKVCENSAVEPANWKDIDMNRERYRLRWIKTALKDESKAILVFDSLAKKNILLFARGKKTSAVVNSQIESAPPIYITEPSPQPARTIAKMKIYHDSSLNIEEAVFNVYNLMGIKVAGRESFTLNRLNHYSAELVWKTEGLPVGAYIVVVRIGNYVYSIAVIKE